MSSTRSATWKLGFLALPLAASLACESVKAGAGGPAGTSDASSASSAGSSQAAPRADGKKLLTLDDLYGPGAVNFSGRPKTTVTWVDGSRWIEKRADEKTKATSWVLVDATTGKVAETIDTSRVTAAIAAIPGVKAEDAAKLVSFDAERTTKDRSALIVNTKGDLWVVRFDSDEPVRLTNTPKVEEEEATFSPDGARVAFLAEHNLYVGDAKLGGATAVTTDGAPITVKDGVSQGVLNGKLDWIYQEEIYGRGTFRAYWWSPDSNSIAFLRLDEAGVPPYTLVDDSTHVPTVETSGYPRPGEPNPTVKLGLASIDGRGAGGAASDANAVSVTSWVDLSAYATSEPLIVDVSWSPKNEVVYAVQDREQTWLDLRIANANGSNDRQLLRETTEAWVDRNDQSPIWLADGSFLWLSERTGFKHLYRCTHSMKTDEGEGDSRPAAKVGGWRVRAVDKRLALTQGDWEVRSVHGVDEAKGLVYFSGTERSVLGSDTYVVGLDGTGLKRLTDREGTHNVTFSTDHSHFVDAWSDLWTPTQVRLFKNDGTLVRAMDENKVESLARYATSKPELLTVQTRDGFDMNAMLIKPVDFDPTKKYPVLMFVYAGPHSQTVKNAWGGSNGMFQQLLAQRGVVVWSCDNRTASGKGAKSAWPCYQRLGVTELADIEDSIDWLVKQGFVDETRVGITGWSYGGFMTSYALTRSQKFALGLAGGSVTNWRSYDSIYTERFMKLPKNNEKGYDETAVAARDRRKDDKDPLPEPAANLHGHLVLAHGQIDDNVHPQNTMRLAYALQRAGADFDLMLYPKSRHGLGDPLLNKHWRATMLRAVDEHLLSATRN